MAMPLVTRRPATGRRCGPGAARFTAKARSQSMLWRWQMSSTHHNGHRAHRALTATVEPTSSYQPNTPPAKVQQRQIIGGIVNEYAQAPWPTESGSPHGQPTRSIGPDSVRVARFGDRRN
jgi:hypothetical protein